MSSADFRARRRALSLVATLATACSGGGASGPTPSPDASADVVHDAAADAASDAATDVSADAVGVASDVPAARAYTWESVEVPSEGPYGRWGYMVASVGDGTAYVYGGTTLTVNGRGTVSNELWRFDARGPSPTATLLTVTGAPPNRYCGCLGYDPTARTLLMIGGRTPTEAPAETWSLALDTMAWRRLDVPTTPGGVIGCQLAWSSMRGAMYLFGGGGERTGFSATIARFDTAAPSWTTLTAAGPRGRYDDVLAPLPDGRRLVMVAGARGAAMGQPFLNDTWLFDTMTETWSQVMTDGPLPPGRRNPWISVDPDGGGLVMAMGAIGLQAGGGAERHVAPRPRVRALGEPRADAPSARAWLRGGAAGRRRRTGVPHERL